MSKKQIFNAEDHRKLAKKALPKLVFDYLDGGAEDELCMLRNRRILDELSLIPKVLNDVNNRDISATLFGEHCEAPFVVGPTGLNGFIRSGGDLLLARAALKAGVPFVLSTASNSTIEDVANLAGGNLWFQLYILSRDITENLTERARVAGYRTLVLTVDAVVGGKRERDLRNGFKTPLKRYDWNLGDLSRRPRWYWRQFRHPTTDLVNLEMTADMENGHRRALSERRMNASFTWDELKRLRDQWPHVLVVKGVLSDSDALKCNQIGADGVVISNHGGRQLDSAPSPFEVLPTLPYPYPGVLMVDSGIRRGSDVVKSIALGAHAVLLGRLPVYGLAHGGEEGAHHVLELLKDEIKTTLALIGCASLGTLNQSYISFNKRI